MAFVAVISIVILITMGIIGYLPWLSNIQYKESSTIYARYKAKLNESAAAEAKLDESLLLALVKRIYYQL